MVTPAQLRDHGGDLASSTAGLILLNSCHRVVYQNPEALRIVTYPKLDNDFPDRLLWSLQPLLDQRSPSGGISEFQSGRRRYLSRSFALATADPNPDHACTGILLERAAPKFLDLSGVAQQFGLTEREQETVQLLTLGLTSKEIAGRMNISPNTVKAFFRLVMTKMAVNTRSGIVGKIARMQSLA